MRFFTLRILLLLFISGSSIVVLGQVKTNSAVLQQAAVRQAEKEKAVSLQLKTLAREKGWVMSRKDSKGNTILLVGMDDAGLPLYLSTENNITAAATIGTSRLWPGGVTGLNLDGSSANVKSKLAIWDGGKIRNTHVELTGRVTQKDGSSSISDHSTHVAGTMIASGVNPSAKGMSFGMQDLWAYDFSNDGSEMLTAAPNLLVSNHSYGFNAGWNYNETNNRWEFLGQFGATEDYKFGYYSDQAQLWDSIAYNAPYYLIVKSAGNNRDVNGPAVGQPYFRYNASGTMAAAGNRPAGISSNDSYDILSLNSVAKNTLTVGAINPISSGYSAAQDVVMSSFSSWGPTDDGRIKPDVVADGVNLLSSIGTSDNSYAVYSGTSMSSPNASGSLLLLQEYYSKLHAGAFMRSATLKGIVIHTADEAGPAAGPDYQYGFGLINMQKAAATITANNTTQLIQENVLNNGGTLSVPVVASGNGTLSATISWTDPKSSVVPLASALDNTAKRLVNDLDIVVKKGATVYRPWILNPAVPSQNATTGDNTLDNVEKIEVNDVVPGESYTIEISHKGTLDRGSQAYSLIVSGVGGTAYCASNPASNSGARIDSVSFSNIQKKNITGCTTYNNYTSLSGNLQPGQSVPIFVRLNSCDATSVDKIVKVYIDVNNDGDFTDALENVATSGVINGNGDYTGSFIVPAGLVPGKFTLLRIVMQETNSAAAVNPCGTYTKGETQDFKIVISTPAKDVGVSEIIDPASGDCSSGTQLVSVRIKNYGTTDQSNISLTGTVKQGATNVAILNATYPGTIPAGADVIYTFQNSFVLNPSTSYTIAVATTLAGDQSAANNQATTIITTSANTPVPVGATATVCGTTATLKANSVSTDVYSWFNTATATTPLGVGATVTTATIVPTYYVAKNDNSTNIGPANKDVFPQGGYNRFSGNFVQFSNSVPVVIESAKLYIGNPSASNKLQFTVGTNFTFDNATGSYSYLPESSTIVDIYATDPTPQAGVQPNDPADPGATFYFNLPVTSTGDHILIIQQAASDNATLYRNNNITTNPYPIGIPGIFTFTGNSATYSSPPGNFQQFYYFFYDMKLSLAGCPSNRTPVVATTAVTPAIGIVGNLLSVTNAVNAGATFQWLLNGTTISGATASTYTATETGIYTVRATDNGCALVSNEISFSVTAIPTVDPAQIGMTVAPNPATGHQFTLRFETTTKSDLGISLVSSTGQRVYGFTVPGFIGKYSDVIAPGKLTNGVYYLQVIHDKKRYVRKIIMAD